MRFAEPEWLVVGAVVVTLVALVLARAERLRSRALALLGEARLRARSAAPSRFRRGLRVVVATLAIAAGFVALARPQKGTRWETTKRTGTDLLLVVDASKSMDADDVKPSRLERAKLAIRDLVDRFPGDRIGLVAFAGDAFVQSPMTLDHAALLESVDALDTQTIGRGGTNIGRGIDVAAKALATEGGAQKIMVLMTDGEDLEGRGLAEAKRAAAAGVTIETVGIGTPAGELVPAHDERGRTVGVVRDASGAPVRSRLDEAGLKAIAEAGHGAYRPLGVDGKGLDRLYDESLAKLTHVEASARTVRVYAELFEVPLAIALGLLVLDALLERRWLARSTKPRRGGRPASSLAAVTAGALLFTAAAPAHASVASAAKAYAAGHFDDAAKAFEEESAKHPSDARLAFNAGDAAYRAGDYAAADAAFKRALAAGSPDVQQHVLYNLGDSLYRVGAAQKPEAREETIAKWKAAITAYDGAIALDPKDQDAIYNRDFVKRRLAALEQQPKRKPKPEDAKKKNDEKGGGGADKKKDQGSSGSKSDAKSGGGGSQSNPAQSGAGDEAKPKDASGKQGQENQQSAAPKQGEGQAAGAPKQEQGQGHGEDEKAGEPGQLSAREARALLDSLRGEERRGVTHGTASGEPTDDVVGKDW